MLNTSLSKFKNPSTQFSTCLSAAQTYRTCPMYKLKVEGKGSTLVQPDVAVITLGSFTEGKELQTAQEENTEIMNNIINAIKAMGVSPKDIQTQTYTINPLYDYIEGEQIFRGYRVTHTLTITIKDINKVGEVVDGSVEQGANIVSDINFTISDSSRYYEKVLTYAIDDAVAKAMTIGNKLGVDISKIPIRIIEKNSLPPSPIESTMLKVSEEVTPIQGGQIKIIAEVEAIFNYFPYK